VGQDNEFKEFEDMMGETGGDEWCIYGGHRLWHAPEMQPRSYFPDNSPIALEQHDDFVRLIEPPEATTGIQKEIDLCLSPDEAHVQVTHRLRNTNLWAVELAVWALTVMTQGGKAIVPLPPRGSHEENLLPTNTLTLWAYTDMTDPRWTWGRKYVMLRQDLNIEAPQKIGALVPDGWVACARNGHLFVKKFNHVAGASYPDFGCSVETFANADMLEVETLAPLVRLQPGAAAEHVEDWFLFDDVPLPQSDADVDEHVLPRITGAKVSLYRRATEPPPDESDS
jgi:hypothetical protein